MNADPASGQSPATNPANLSVSLTNAQTNSPIRETSVDPHPPSAADKAHLKTESVESLDSYARSRYATGEQDWTVVYCLEACMGRKGMTPDVYLDLALADLVVGRFDSAVAVLENAQKQVPNGSPYQARNRRFEKQAKKVPAALDRARDEILGSETR